MANGWAPQGSPIARPPGAPAPPPGWAGPPPGYLPAGQGYGFQGLPPNHPAIAKARNARGWGIAAIICVWIPYFTLFGIGFAITALVMGSGAKGALAAYGESPALGHARTAVVLGIVALCVVPLIVILAAVVFVLVTKVSATAFVLLGL